MKLLKIGHTEGKPLLVAISGTHWKLMADYSIWLTCDDGVRYVHLYPGWITDKRSGSSVCDWVIPKEGTPDQLALVLFHDAAYSGWTSRAVADDILYQGWIMTGIAPFLARAAYASVRLAGGWGYYSLDQPMSYPYQANRTFELYRHSDRRVGCPSLQGFFPQVQHKDLAQVVCNKFGQFKRDIATITHI